MTMTATELPSKLLSVRPPKRPYPGLRPFELDEWMIFFGREKMIEDVIERLARQRLVFIHGASGSGKSSLVRAGVLPKLARQHKRHGEGWDSCVMRPSGGPLWNLAQEFARFEGRSDDYARVDKIVRLFNRRGATLSSVAGDIEGLAGKRICILVDQFEELFRFEREFSREEAELFIDLLIGEIETTKEHDGEVFGPPAPPAPVNERHAKIHVIVTMRSEFLGECARFDGLAEAINSTQYLVPRLSREALLRAIQRPAEIYGGEVTMELAERLIAEVRGREDELPLMQHGLMQLWNTVEANTNDKIKLDVGLLDKAVSLADLLSDHADRVMELAFTVWDEPRRQAVENLFRALVEETTKKQGIRRPQQFKELLAVSTVSAHELKIIIDAFRADGVSFLTPPPPTAIKDETTIDISHEALIRCWKKIADPEEGWLKRETEAGLAWSSLLAEAKEFATNPKRLLSAAAAEDWKLWFAKRTQPWCDRYGGNWELVEKFVETSVREAKGMHRLAAFAKTTFMLIASITLFIALIPGTSKPLYNWSSESIESSARLIAFIIYVCVFLYWSYLGVAVVFQTISRYFGRS